MHHGSFINTCAKRANQICTIFIVTSKVHQKCMERKICEDLTRGAESLACTGSFG